MSVTSQIDITDMCPHTITVQENNAVMDGKGGMPDNWSDKYTGVVSRVRPASAREQAEWGGLPAILTHIVYVANGALVIEEKNRVVFGTRIFDVLGSRNMDELDNFLTLNVREIR